MQDQQLALLPDVVITSRSLTLPENCSLELWESCGTKIGVFAEAGPFIIGDWINEGIRHHGVSLIAWLKSSAAKTMPGISSFSYDSLNTFAVVMDKIPPDHRVKGVSFAHHLTASKLIRSKSPSPEDLTEVKKWLMISRDKNLSTKALAMAIKGRTRIVDIEAKPEPKTEQAMPVEQTISDIAITLHRLFDAAVKQLSDPDDKIADWSPERKEAAIAALDPLLDDIAAFTDAFIELRK